MAVYCFGSVNIDHSYTVPHLPAPGETLSAIAYQRMLGGKGANQSVAAARAGATVHHIGAIGAGDDWIATQLRAAGVAPDLHVSDQPTGHAIINVDPGGENSIVIYGGANTAQSPAHLLGALGDASADDTLLLQNETDLQVEAARLGREKGMRVMYSAAPFDPQSVGAVLHHVDLLVMNAVEAEQLVAAMGKPLDDLNVPEILVTLGADGVEWRGQGEVIRLPGVPVTPVDTTGAGDTFAGYFAAARDRGMTPREALDLARHAAALKVTRHGTAEAIPSYAEVVAFMK